MPVITSIKPQKNNKRVNVYLDGKFGFGIDLDNFVLLGLKVDKELSDKEIEEIVKKAEFQKTYDKILKFATFRPRSKKELIDWLKRKKVHESLFKGLFDRLNQLDLIDDKKFAAWWIEQRTNFKPKGKKALAFELREKGIDREIIKLLLASLSIDEEKLAQDLLKKKAYKWKNLSKDIARRKMSEFLARRGFGWGIIGKVTGIDRF